MPKISQRLPIGSVVRITHADVPVMIVGQMPLLKQDGIGEGYCDYSAVLGPVGYDGQNMLFFNQEDIVDVIFIGFVDLNFQRYLNDVAHFHEETDLTQLHPEMRITLMDTSEEGSDNEH